MENVTPSPVDPNRTPEGGVPDERSAEINERTYPIEPSYRDEAPQSVVASDSIDAPQRVETPAPVETPGPVETPARGEAGSLIAAKRAERMPERPHTPTPDDREQTRTFSENREATAPPEQRRRVTASQRRVLGFTWIGIFSMLIYAVFMGMAFFTPGYSFVDRIASVILLFGIFFILMHGMGYANSMIKASWGYDEVKRRIFTPQKAPKVACVVASFNEPLDVVEETIAALVNVDYPNKEIVILDDSTKEESRQGIREIGERYGVQVRQRTNRRGYKAGAINDYLPTTDAEFIAVFDADGLPAHNFLRDVVPIIQENPRLAFVQTPQHYANVEVSAVAMGAARQQAVFYEYICEGKSYSRAAFCCGTNVVFRRDALLAVGGFDENSVTEDFATSLNMHLRGYDSAYYNQIYVYSLAPETLNAYFTQQGRWAFGSVGSMRKVIGAMFTKAARLRPGQWWEYFLSSTYYWVGWINFLFMLLPIMYIFFGIKPLRQDVFTYLAIFIPYMIFTMNMFYAGMEDRGYRVLDMILGQQINFLCFPVHMTAALSGILGLKRPFAITPKGVGGRLSWLALWPQLLMLFLSAVAFIWGMYRYLSGQDANTAAIVINSMWALYHVFLLSGVFRLNRPISRPESKRYFADRSQVVQVGAPVAAGAGVGAAGVTAATAGGVVGQRRDGNSVFAPGAAEGKIVAPPRLRPQRTRPGGALGHMAMGLSILSLIAILAVAWTMGKWYMSPTFPTRVYILDRTAGRDYQEHRALTWTLNFLRVSKPAAFDPSDTKVGNTNYNFAHDYYGFVPGDPSTAQKDPTNQADLVVGGRNVQLPSTLEAPGVMFLADAYGEFVEYDYNQNKYIRYRNEERGILPDDVDRIEEFYNKKGLVVGEWNTIGYPTLPALEDEGPALNAKLAQARKDIQFLKTKELPARQAQLARAKAANDKKWQGVMEQQIAQTKEGIRKTQLFIDATLQQIARVASRAEQIAAQQRLEKILHVDYQGWYGRYVDKFEEEREYDFRLWKSVRDHLSQVYKDDKSKWEPRGPGFVFYRDGQKSIFNPETNKYEENPFSEPFVITQEELRFNSTNDIATINLNSKLKGDPLLNGVADQIPCRFWFDVVKPDTGSLVLSFYKLLIKQSAADRLLAEGFPAQYLKTDNNGNAQIVFPAAVASRDGGENGQLRSFYFAGDASDYSLVSRFSEMVPATGGVSYFLGSKVGPFPMQYYWKYYEPLVHNVIVDSKQVRAQ